MNVRQTRTVGHCAPATKCIVFNAVAMLYANNACLFVASLGGIVDANFLWHVWSFDVHLPLADGLRWSQMARITLWDLLVVVVDEGFVDLELLCTGSFLLGGPNCGRIALLVGYYYIGGVAPAGGRDKEKPP